jgi:hypothetical protein
MLDQRGDFRGLPKELERGAQGCGTYADGQVDYQH